MRIAPARAGGFAPRDRHQSKQENPMTFVPAGVELTGATLYIEVDTAKSPPAHQGPQTAAVTPAALLPKLEAAGEAAGEACLALYTKMRDKVTGEAAPSEVSVEFGITLGGEAGVPFVAKGTAEATFKVTAKWDFSAPDTRDPARGS